MLLVCHGDLGLVYFYLSADPRLRVDANHVRHCGFSESVRCQAQTSHVSHVTRAGKGVVVLKL